MTKSRKIGLCLLLSPFIFLVVSFSAITVCSRFVETEWPEAQRYESGASSSSVLIAYGYIGFPVLKPSPFSACIKTAYVVMAGDVVWLFFAFWFGLFYLLKTDLK
jgi:hypothetical protein